MILKFLTIMFEFFLCIKYLNVKTERCIMILKFVTIVFHDNL